MILMRRPIFDEDLQEMRRQLGGLLNAVPATLTRESIGPEMEWQPPVEQFENAHEVVIKASLPNVDPTQVDITINDDAVTIKEIELSIINRAFQEGWIEDRLPRRTRSGRHRMPLQYHLMLQTAAFAHSALAGWEAPDPGYWVPRGYVVINADLRGWGRSDGVGQVLSAQEGLDGHDLVEWAASQPWSSGRVGMSGVSYLAIAQWATAAASPPHLAAICPWEGFTDAYRDFGRPGGLRNDGFFRVWAFGLKVQRRMSVNLRREQKRRPLRDQWWAARDRDLAAITTPALICGSFSDHDLHSGGSFDGFRRIASDRKWLYTHRGPKWATFYSPAGLAAQAEFFDHFLRGEDTGIGDRPRVRVEVRGDVATIAAVRGADDWPPPNTRWTPLHLVAGTTATTGTLTTAGARPAGSVSLVGHRGRASFIHQFDRDTEIIGPMALRLHVELPYGGDVSVFAAVRKFRDGREVTFEGSYGFRGDVMGKL